MPRGLVMVAQLESITDDALGYRVPEGILWCRVSGGAAPDLAGFPGYKEEAPVYDMR